MLRPVPQGDMAPWGFGERHDSNTAACWHRAQRQPSGPLLTARTLLARRAEYFSLWDQQRKLPVSIAVLDEEVDLAAPKAGRQRVQEKQQQQPAIDPALKAEQVRCLSMRPEFFGMGCWSGAWAVFCWQALCMMAVLRSFWGLECCRPRYSTVLCMTHASLCCCSTAV
jgi:hypothetical protein